MKRDSSSVESERLSTPVSKKDHIQGRSNAAVTLVEYGDYECPACGATHEIVKMLQEKMGPKLRFVFRHFPLEKHPHAERAAEAAEAAAVQGRFWEMHDALFENQDALEDEDILEYATDLGLDAGQLLSDFQSGKHRPRVREDFQSGIRSGVNGTPTFYINDARYDGPLEAASLLASLQHAAED